MDIGDDSPAFRVRPIPRSEHPEGPAISRRGTACPALPASHALPPRTNGSSMACSVALRFRCRVPENYIFRPFPIPEARARQSCGRRPLSDCACSNDSPPEAPRNGISLALPSGIVARLVPPVFGSTIPKGAHSSELPCNDDERVGTYDVSETSRFQLASSPTRPENPDRVPRSACPVAAIEILLRGCRRSPSCIDPVLASRVDTGEVIVRTARDSVVRVRVVLRNFI